MKPTITVARKSNAPAVLNNVAKLAKKQVYVGIPSGTDRQRQSILLGMAGRATGKKKDKLLKAASQDVTNAELMWIHSKGSPIRGIPARPVIEPAIVAEGNKEVIARELAGAAKGVLDGDAAETTKYLKRAGIAGQNAARGWFTRPDNGLAPNAPSTIAAKGSDRPLIDTGALRSAISYVVKDE